MNLMQKVILKEHPNYDPNRYRFKAGDFVTTLDGARICVKYSAIDYVVAYVMSRSLVYRTSGEQRVYYKDLPMIPKDGFINNVPKINESLQWSTYDIVRGDYANMLVLLYEELDRPQEFYGWVLSCENNYYLHMGVYIVNPYRNYILYPV